jgi:hypothetical protein
LVDDCAKRDFLHVGYHFGVHPTAALFEVKNRSLVVIAATAPGAMGLPADKRLVRLDVAFQHFEAISFFHQLPYLMTNPPRCFIRDAARSLQLLAAHAVSGRNKQIDRIEPSLQRRVTVMEDRPCARIDMVAAMRAREGAAVGDLMIRRIFVALRADVAQPEADIHDSRQATVVARELGEEFLDRKGLYGTGLLSDLAGAFSLACHFSGTLMLLCIGHPRTCVKGIIPQTLPSPVTMWQSSLELAVSATRKGGTIW